MLYRVLYQRFVSSVEKRLYSGVLEAFKEAVSDAHINVCAVMKKRSIGMEVQYIQ